MIWCDTRQQAGKHKNIDGWFDAHGVAYEYKKLDFGDYMRDGSNISIDTKRSVDELAANLGRDHARFARECERARDAGYRLVILIEQKQSYQNDMLKLARWLPYSCKRCEIRFAHECEPRDGDACKAGHRTPMQGATMLKTMKTMNAHYGVQFRFCGRNDTARIICETLGEEVPEIGRDAIADPSGRT